MGHGIPLIGTQLQQISQRAQSWDLDLATSIELRGTEWRELQESCNICLYLMMHHFASLLDLVGDKRAVLPVATSISLALSPLFASPTRRHRSSLLDLMIQCEPVFQPQMAALVHPMIALICSHYSLANLVYLWQPTLFDDLLDHATYHFREVGKLQPPPASLTALTTFHTQCRECQGPGSVVSHKVFGVVSQVDDEEILASWLGKDTYTSFCRELNSFYESEGKGDSDRGSN